MITALQTLYAWITSTTLGKVAVSAFVSMLPIVELRGGIPVAVGLGLPLEQSLLICILANCVPIIPVLLLFRFLLKTLRKFGGVFSRCANWLETRAAKHQKTLDKYAAFGLFLLTAIPLPGTGAWTASMLAALAQVPIRKSAPAIILGVLAAGAIVSVVTYGVFSLV